MRRPPQSSATARLVWVAVPAIAITAFSSFAFAESLGTGANSWLDSDISRWQRVYEATPAPAPPSDRQQPSAAKLPLPEQPPQKPQFVNPQVPQAAPQNQLIKPESPRIDPQSQIDMRQGPSQPVGPPKLIKPRLQGVGETKQLAKPELPTGQPRTKRAQPKTQMPDQYSPAESSHSTAVGAGDKAAERVTAGELAEGGQTGLIKPRLQRASGKQSKRVTKPKQQAVPQPPQPTSPAPSTPDGQ